MIHRTRDGMEPSGGPEAGCSIVKIGNVYVEYSGTEPTQDDLQAHLHREPEDPIDVAERNPFNKAIIRELARLSGDNETAVKARLKAKS